MADDKPLRIGSSGNVEEFTPITVSTGAPDAGKVVKLDAAGKFDITVMPNGVSSNTFTATASENLAAGDYVNVYNNAGTLSARKADASTAAAARKASGYVLVAVLSGNTATVYTDDTNSAVSGLTLGGDVWLSGTTPGQVTQTPVTTSGYILQRLGQAISATSISTEIGEPIIRG